MNRQNWSGNFKFGDLWGAYVGRTSDNSAHAHAAVQVALAVGSDVSIEVEDGETISAETLIVGPQIRHRLLPSSGLVTIVYVEQLSPLAARLLETIRPKKVGAPPRSAKLALNKNESPRSWIERVSLSLGTPAGHVDARIATALKAAAHDGAPGAVGRAAIAAGLSQARLRALAKEQLGVPVSQLLLWRKLAAASHAIAGGETLSASAAAGGFTDQAHMTRTMRRMLGITPASARMPLKGSNA